MWFAIAGVMQAYFGLGGSENNKPPFHTTEELS